MSNINTKICYIVAACKELCDDIKFSPKKEDIVIAADGGYDILEKTSVKPDILIGDFDSIEKLPERENIIKHPKEKDDTDTFLAYKLAYNKGYRNFVIIGGLGGRIDHTYANFQLLLNIARSDSRGFLIGNNSIITTIYNSKLSFSHNHKGTISVFAQGDIAENVDIKGFKYFAENIVLKPDFPLGISNEFVGERSYISVEKGSLLINWNEKTEAFLSHIEDFLI